MTPLLPEVTLLSLGLASSRHSIIAYWLTGLPSDSFLWALKCLHLHDGGNDIVVSKSSTS